MPLRLVGPVLQDMPPGAVQDQPHGQGADDWHMRRPGLHDCREEYRPDDRRWDGIALVPRQGDRRGAPQGGGGRDQRLRGHRSLQAGVHRQEARYRRRRQGQPRVGQGGRTRGFGGLLAILTRAAVVSQGDGDQEAHAPLGLPRGAPLEHRIRHQRCHAQDGDGRRRRPGADSVRGHPVRPRGLHWRADIVRPQRRPVRHAEGGPQRGEPGRPGREERQRRRARAQPAAQRHTGRCRTRDEGRGEEGGCRRVQHRRGLLHRERDTDEEGRADRIERDGAGARRAERPSRCDDTRLPMFPAVARDTREVHPHQDGKHRGGGPDRGRHPHRVHARQGARVREGGVAARTGGVQAAGRDEAAADSAGVEGRRGVQRRADEGALLEGEPGRPVPAPREQHHERARTRPCPVRRLQEYQDEYGRGRAHHRARASQARRACVGDRMQRHRVRQGGVHGPCEGRGAGRRGAAVVPVGAVRGRGGGRPAVRVAHRVVCRQPAVLQPRDRGRQPPRGRRAPDTLRRCGARGDAREGCVHRYMGGRYGLPCPCGHDQLPLRQHARHRGAGEHRQGRLRRLFHIREGPGHRRQKALLGHRVPPVEAGPGGPRGREECRLRSREGHDHQRAALQDGGRGFDHRSGIRRLPAQPRAPQIRP